MKLIELVKYEAAIEKLLGLWRGLRGTAVGGTVTVPELITDLGNEEWKFAAHEATRLR